MTGPSTGLPENAGQWLIDISHRIQSLARQRPALLDVMVAFLAAVLALAELNDDGLAGVRGPDLVAVVLILGSAAVLLARRFVPLIVLVVITAVLVVLYSRDYGAFFASLGVLAVYSAAAHARSRRTTWIVIALATVTLLLAAGLTQLAAGDGYRFANGISIVLVCAIAAAGGGIVRNRTEIFESAQARAEHAEETRLAEAERAVGRERLRIAREMHDVVAHSMSVVAIQASAAQEIVHHDPEKAAAVMANVEAAGREALNELRRVLGVLRKTGDTDSRREPQPTLADLPNAVAQSNAAGVVTELVIRGGQRELPAGVELAAFRIVQEGLTNVRKHAGDLASVEVTLDYRPTTLNVKVVDDGAGTRRSLTRTGAGDGIVGMRERVAIYGGDLVTGPLPTGGFKIEAALPLPTPSATEIAIQPAE